MKHWTRTVSMIFVIAGLAVAQTPRLRADRKADQKRVSVTVSFGAGLNTNQPGNAANHHVLPRTIRIKAGGVVNFVVAGFHQILVFLSGTRPEDLVIPDFPVPGAPPRTNLFIDDIPSDDITTVYYRGINPAGGPPPATAATISPSNAVNRVESVVFTEPGTYLVICNVTPHFRDGMFAFVKVSGHREDD